MLSLVSKQKQIIDNIITFNSELESQVSLQKKLSNFKHWYYYEDKDMFAPSKFIGYEGNTAEFYEEGTKTGISYMTGRDTEPVLKAMKISVVVTGNELDKLYKKLECLIKEYDKVPNKGAVIHKIIL